MLRQLSVILVLFLFLAGIVHYGSKIRITWFPETPEPHPPIPVASVQAGAKPSLRQAAGQALPRTPDAPVTNSPSENPTAQTTAASETAVQAVTHSTPPASADIHSPATTSAPHTPPTASTTHAAASITAATLGPATAPGPPTATPSDLTSVSSLSTVGHKTETRTQSSHRTALPATVSTRPHTSTASEVPAQPTPTAHNATEPVHTAGPSPTAHSTTQPVHTAGPTPTSHNTTQPSPSTSSAPGPTVAPQPSTVKTGTYQVLNGSRLCIKAEMGLELMVQDLASVFSPKSYFSIDPNTTQASGNCGFRKSNLLVNFPGGFVNLTFTKDKNSYYVSEVRAYLTISNPEKSYSGLKSSLMMFEAVLGHSFKCVSEQSVQLSLHLQLKVTNTQLQAFDFEGDHFGNVDECSSDYTVMLPVIGAVVLALCALGLIVYGIRLRHEWSGYHRI